MKPLPPPWDRFVPFLRRLSIWAAFFLLLWFLRPFFLLVFLTFVFGYIQEHAVEALETKFKRRVPVVIGVFVTLLAVLVGFGWLVGPELYRQARDLPVKVAKISEDVDHRIARLRTNSEFFGALIPPETTAKSLLGQFYGTLSQPSGGDENGPSNPARFVLGLVKNGLATGSSFLLSLLFSFLIVLDLPKIARGLRRLRESRARFVYDELSDTIFEFGRVLGRALEAQLMIATLNTTFTFIGLKILGLEYVVFLSAVVFLCSFIPVAGVFISSVPIGLVALDKGGAPLMLWSIAFITVIHMIEAYILNPRIYGAHLRMNPVMTLAILFVSEHLFGIWGLILGVPVTSYVIRHVVMDVRQDGMAKDETAAIT